MRMLTKEQREKREAAEAAERHKTALHEAGHAVVGQALGYRVGEVMLRSAESGHCDVEMSPRGDTLTALERELSFVLAGRLAGAIAEGKSVRHLSETRRLLEEPAGYWLTGTLDLESRSSGMGSADYRKAAAALLGDGELAGYHWLDKALPAAAGEAVRILRERWDDVESLARRLDAEGKVELAETNGTRRGTRAPVKTTTKARSSTLSPRAARLRDAVRRGEVDLGVRVLREVR
jgi:hypothetical protein